MIMMCCFGTSCIDDKLDDQHRTQQKRRPERTHHDPVAMEDPQNCINYFSKTISTLSCFFPIYFLNFLLPNYLTLFRRKSNVLL